MTGVRSACRRRLLGIFALFAISTFLLTPNVNADCFDWRNVNGQNWVTSVKDQGGVGTCWDFAGCGILEAKYMLTRGDTTYQPDVSEQQLLCAGVGSISGGNAYQVDQYAVSTGVVLESELPYTQQNTSPLWPLSAGWQNRVFKGTYADVTIAQGTNLATVKNALEAYGPLTIKLNTPGDWYNCQDDGGTSGSHEVVIVGFHDNVGSENAPGGGYWIVKNSWGATWNGDGNHNGYGEIAYATQPSYSDWSWLGIYNNNVTGLNGPVYFTGAMATVNWTGGSSGAWTLGGNLWSGVDMYGNSLPTFTWSNCEAVAVFNGAGSAIPVIGPVVAHGVTINSGATGYVFNGTAGGKLTVTGGGIVTHESATFNLPVSIGAPQTWTIDSGKSLVINGDLHTIISNLTLTSNGDTTITGNIDGGSVLTYGFNGIAPGTITMNGSGTLHLTGAATYSVPLTVAAGAVSFEQAGTNVANYTNTISGGGTVNKTNSGTIILSGANSYTGWTQLYGGIMQADRGAGLPNASALVLFGGVLQSNSAVTYTDKFWNDSPGNHCLSWFGGGFAGGGGAMTVNLYGDGRTVTWTGNGNTGIAGPIQLSSSTAQYATVLQNGLNFNGAEQTVFVDDNPNSTGDYAVLSGVLTGGTAGGIIKTGSGRLVPPESAAAMATTTAIMAEPSSLRACSRPARASFLAQAAFSSTAASSSRTALSPEGGMTNGMGTISRGTTAVLPPTAAN